METFVEWCGFLGAWLLVAGPVYQAALELREEEIEEGRFRTVAAKVSKPTEISDWWWLLPPVKIVLERRRSKVYRRDVLAALPSEDVEAWISFINKATGWLFVAGGGFLLAINETYQLDHAQHWSLVIFWLMIVILTIASVLNTAVRIIRGNQIVARHHQ